MPRICSRICLLVLLLLAGSPVAADEPHSPSLPRALTAPAVGSTTSADRIDAALDALRFGTREERLDVADRARELFAELGGREVDKSGTAPILSALLDVVFEDEGDEWVLYKLSRGLVQVDGRPLNPLFAELLDHPSPNVRRSAGMHFSSHLAGDDLAKRLDRAWRREQHTRVRQVLLAALIYNGRSIDADDLRELVNDDDPALAWASMLEVSELATGDAFSVVADRSFEDPLWLREEALTLLLEWKDTAEAVAVLGEHIAGDEPTMRNHAARQLRWLEHPDAVTLMAGLVRDATVDVCVRRAAAASLDPTLPGAEQALLDLLAEPTTPDNADVQRAAAYRLARAGLSAIDSTEIPNEQRHYDCEWNAAPRSWRVEPPESLASIRCWAEPGHLASADRDARLSRGREIDPRDYFDDADGEPWMLDVQGCWARAAYVVAVTDPTEESDDDDETRRVEIEATPEELEHPALRELMDLGLIEPADPAEGIVAITVHVEGDAGDGIDPLQVVRSVLRGPLWRKDGQVADAADGAALRITGPDGARREP